MSDAIKNPENSDLENFISPADILNEAASLIAETQKPSDRIGLLKVKTANEWIAEAKLRPIPKMLFGKL